MNHWDDDEDLFDGGIADFKDYEDYLDAQLEPQDLFYLEDKELARHLIEEGCHGKGEILSREDFKAKKDAIELAKRLRNEKQTKLLSHSNTNHKHSQFLTALAAREDEVRSGRMTTIIFLRHKKNNRELSAYIDLADRLKTDDFKAIFEGKKKLMPRTTDLSYFHWEAQTPLCNNSPNFRVDAHDEKGLIFRNRRDRKIINVNPAVDPPGDGTKRVELDCPDEYTQVVFFDHMTRRKH